MNSSSDDGSSTVKPPPKVLLWSINGAGEHYTGPGSFMYRMYSLASKTDVSVSLAHGYPDQTPEDLFAEQTYIGDWRGKFKFFKFLHQSKKFLQRNYHKHDVMHALNGFHTTVGPAGVAQRLGLPVVLFVTNHREEFVDKGGVRGLLGLPAKRRRIIRELSALVSMSTDIYEELREYNVLRKNIARIPMGVNVERFSPCSVERKAELRRELGITDRPTVLIAGAMVRRKRPLLVAQAIEEANRTGTECQAYLVGPHDREPDYAEEIKSYIADRNLTEFVKLVHFTPNIEQYHQASDLFILPSEQEGMPAAMVEAMACGVPPVGTAISGVNDLIDDGVNGRIVEPTAESCADAFKFYFNTPGRLAEHGKLCRDLVIQRYGAEAVLAAHLNLFHIILDGGDPCDASILPEME
ncbi:MAG: glycosyltransferase family 4 protein [Planctomycetales bacterium]|nr:glycosyltransferase family 4 protein [Planctomycetales bacterium]